MFTKAGNQVNSASNDSMPAGGGGENYPDVDGGGGHMKVVNKGQVNGSIVINTGAAVKVEPSRTKGSIVTGSININGGKVIVDQNAQVNDDADGDGWPVNELFSGEVQLQVTDMAIPGRGLDFIFARTYRSRTDAFSSGVMGSGWTHSCDIFATQTNGGVAVADGTGRNDIYFLGTNGLYSRDQFFNSGSMSNGAFVLTFPDTSQWVFNPFNSSTGAGKISSSVDRNGNRHIYIYGGQGQLTAMVDDLGRTNQFTYNTSGQLRLDHRFHRAFGYLSVLRPGPNRRFTRRFAFCHLPAGDRHAPNGNDFPQGKTTTYTYSTGFKNPLENHLLLSITDPKGQTSHQFIYQHNPQDPAYLRCISEQCGYTNEVSTYAYIPQTPAPGNNFAALRVIVNDAAGNVSEYYYDSRNRLLQEDDYTGRAMPGVPTTATVNRPVNPLRSSDPAYYQTQWSWNNDSLCTLETDAQGMATQMIYERDFNANASPQKKGDLRILRETEGQDTDGNGGLDRLARARYMSYDPSFGSPALSYRAGTHYWIRNSNSSGIPRVVNPEAVGFAITGHEHHMGTDLIITGGASAGCKLRQTPCASRINH